MKSDTQLKKDVEAELEWDPAVNPAAVGVTVRAGIVTLTGDVANMSEKLAAERAAQRVDGVQGVALEIRVVLPDDAVRTDTEIARAAADALRWNNLVPGDQIKVRAEDGFLHLSGDVDWGYQRSAAEKVVRHLAGVRGVHNAIQIIHRATPSNVQHRIEAALKRAAHVDAEAITVRINDGDVTLEGRVPSVAVRRIVEEAAWAAPGVRSVTERLQVGSPVPPANPLP